MGEISFAVEVLVIMFVMSYGVMSMILIYNFIKKTFNRAETPKRVMVWFWYILHVLVWAGLVLYEFLRVLNFLFGVKIIKF